MVIKKPKKRHLPHEGASYYYVAPWSTRAAPKAPSEVPWCTKSRISLAGELTGKKSETGLYASFGKVRCPKCGRRLQIMTVDIENGYGDFWPYLPPHKIRELKMKEGRKKTGRSVTRDRRGARGK